MGGRKCQEGEGSSWDQQGVTLQLGCYVSHCGVSGQVLAHARCLTSTGVGFVPVGASLWKMEKFLFISTAMAHCGQQGLTAMDAELKVGLWQQSALKYLYILLDGHTLRPI